MEVKEIRQIKTKEGIIEILDTNGIDYSITTLKCGEDKYKVYTSMRKINAFKKAMLKLGNDV